jgi:sulfide:quinone oxidoreductase
MKLKVTVLGAGFGGLELASVLSERIGDRLDLTLIDRNASFHFGYSKIDVMFGRTAPAEAKHGYSAIGKKGVRFVQATVTSIDPVGKTVVTSAGTFEADVLVVAMGADYDYTATPGLLEAGNEFYSMEGAERIREILPHFKKGDIIVGVTSAPFKCPPAPSETALLLHDHLVGKGVRDDCSISLVIPFPVPIPPSPDSSKVLIESFAERGIRFIANRRVERLDAAKKAAVLDDGTELPYDLFLGVPKHVAPAVVVESGLTENGWIPVSRDDLQTRFPGVYAVGDVTSVGTPKAGVFAEGAARIAAEAIIDRYEGKPFGDTYKGMGSCYLEFGEGKVAKVEVDFFSGEKPKGVHHEASLELNTDKKLFGSSRVERWFGAR